MIIITNGILTGLLLSVLIGATFFMLIETSMTRGFKAALWFDAGVVLSDALIIAGAYFFTSWITNTIIHNRFFNEAGGIVFIAFGVNYILARRKNDTGFVVLYRNVRVFLNGFIINMMNPSVILFWLGTMALTLTNFKYTGREAFLYYTCALLTMVILDVLKAYFSYRLSNLINASILRSIYLFSGILMIGLGVWFIFR